MGEKKEQEKGYYAAYSDNSHQPYQEMNEGDAPPAYSESAVYPENPEEYPKYNNERADLLAGYRNAESKKYNESTKLNEARSNSEGISYATEPTFEEFTARGPGKVISTGTMLMGFNSMRCGACKQNLIIKDKSILYLLCPKCKNLTPKLGVHPSNTNMKFTRCRGPCKKLFLIHKDEKQYVCPNDNLVFKL